MMATNPRMCSTKMMPSIIGNNPLTTVLIDIATARTAQLNRVSCNFLGS